MDRILPKKTWTTKRLLTAGGVTGLALLIGFSYYATSGKQGLNVPKERITICEIRKGVFQESIPVNGVVMPLTTIYLDAPESGRVQERYVEDGTVLKKDQPILKLANTNLELNLVAQETGVFGLLTQMQLSHINARQNTVVKLTQMEDIQSSLEEAERVYDVDKRLYAQRVIGSQEFKQAGINYRYYSRKEKLFQELLKQDTISTKEQLEQDKQSYARARHGLQIMRQKVGDLIVRSPADGQVTSLDAEVGQSKKEGERLGQIDVLSGFKVRVAVDEHYITRVFPGQTGDFTFADKLYKLTITKIFTQVANNVFQVDMRFIGAPPQGIRRGQTLQITLALSDAKTAVMVAQGGFYQQTGGNWIFKVSEDGKKAYKVDIQLGQKNTDFYEVLQGLKPGDKVVTSSYENYGHIEELLFNN